MKNPARAPSDDGDRYRIDLDLCPTPILLVSFEGIINRSNARADALFGYDPGELRGQSVEILVPEEIRDYHPELRNAFAELPTTRRMGTGRDLNGVHKNGSLLPIEIGLDPIELSGQPLILVSVLDIRERKTSEAIIRRALDAASSAMVQVNSEGTIDLVNKEALRLFGYARHELIGQSIELLVPERLRRKHSVYRMSYLNNHQARTMGSGRELFVRRKDGAEIPVEIGLTPIDDHNGRSTMATVIDVSERKAKEQRIEAQATQLRTLNDELLQFAYSASHDLKAPLASVTGLLGFCIQDLDAGDIAEVKCNLEKAKQLAIKLAGRIEETLTQAKTGNAGDLAHIDIASRLGEVWSAVGSDQIHVETNLQHTIPFQCSPSRFDSILENLLSNAVKYRTPDQRSQVTVTSWDQEDTLFLSVEDNGIGIPEKQQNKVFHLFRRATNRGDGSGLGLALVMKHVTYLGGEVTVESEPGHTVFTVSFPQRQVTIETKPTEHTS